jgi:putative transposase
MVTCGTYEKAHFLYKADMLDMLRDLLFDCMEEAGWKLHAWALLSNHYHFIASSPTDPSSLRRVLSKLHTLSARELNRQDNRPGRKVWFQYFDTHITFPNSYLPRLKYVHQNPMHHGVTHCAENYPWCSAAWFARSVTPAFRATVEAFKIDRLSVGDAFNPEMPVTPPTESGVKPPHSK